MPPIPAFGTNAGTNWSRYRETIGIKADNAGGVNDMARPFITGRFEVCKCFLRSLVLEF